MYLKVLIIQKKTRKNSI